MYGLLPELWSMIANDLQTTIKLIRVSTSLNQLLTIRLSSIINHPTDQDLLFVGLKKYYQYSIKFLQPVSLMGNWDNNAQYCLLNGNILTPIYDVVDQPYHLRCWGPELLSSSLFISHELLIPYITNYLDPSIVKICSKSYGNRYILIDRVHNIYMASLFPRLDGRSTRYLDLISNADALEEFIGCFNQK